MYDIFGLFRDGKMQTMTVFMNNGTQMNCIRLTSFLKHLWAKYYSSKVMLPVFFDYCRSQMAPGLSQSPDFGDSI